MKFHLKHSNPTYFKHNKAVKNYLNNHFREVKNNFSKKGKKNILSIIFSLI
jgi:hypothetical protein